MMREEADLLDRMKPINARSTELLRAGAARIEDLTNAPDEPCISHDLRIVRLVEANKQPGSVRCPNRPAHK